ncbi:hypothetical protein L810_4318 [Burkholderia sp. AU4i]|nr:hypothetical protein L810_4318 [Burkholderia sp. AU4i]MDW9231270.1 hypothetical protein [Burkholderia cepacia]
MPASVNGQSYAKTMRTLNFLMRGSRWFIGRATRNAQRARPVWR